VITIVIERGIREFVDLGSIQEQFNFERGGNVHIAIVEYAPIEIGDLTSIQDSDPMVPRHGRWD